MAILRLIEMEKAVVEGAGAIGLAAVLADKVPELKGKKYVAYLLQTVLFSGDVDLMSLPNSLETGDHCAKFSAFASIRGVRGMNEQETLLTEPLNERNKS